MRRILINRKNNISLKSVKRNGLENLKNLKGLSEYTNNMQDVCKNFGEQNPTKCNVLIVFDDVIVYMISNKETSQNMTGCFIIGKNIKFFNVCVTQSFFAAPKNVRLKQTHFLLLQI